MSQEMNKKNAWCNALNVTIANLYEAVFEAREREEDLRNEYDVLGYGPGTETTGFVDADFADGGPIGVFNGRVADDVGTCMTALDAALTAIETTLGGATGTSLRKLG